MNGMGIDKRKGQAMQEQEQDIEQQLDSEIAKRLAIMEDPSYEYPARISRRDVIAIVTIIVVCIGMLIYGIV